MPVLMCIDKNEAETSKTIYIYLLVGILSLGKLHFVLQILIKFTYINDLVTYLNLNITNLSSKTHTYIYQTLIIRREIH